MKRSDLIKELVRIRTVCKRANYAPSADNVWFAIGTIQAIVEFLIKELEKES